MEVCFYSINCCTKDLQNLKSYHSDFLLQPDTSNLTVLGFNKNSALKAIKVGETEAKRHIKEIVKRINED